VPARWDGPVCGAPMRYYELSRPRDDKFPVCCRPPHAERELAEGRPVRHQSRASVTRAREHWREIRYRRKMSDPGDRNLL
jgi:hypothetical protein